MSNHLSKSLFSIPRLKKSRSRQQNQPENPTSLCLNALTADDAFLRFAAALGEPFFSSRNPERNFIIFLCIPLPPRPFSPLKSPKGNFIIFPCIPRLPRPFLSPCSPERNFIFSLYIHPPSAAARGSRAALQYFRSYRPPFTTRGTGSPNMPNTSNDRARNALRSAETEKFSRPQTLLPSQIGVQGDPAAQDGYKKRIYPSAWRGIYYTGIIGRGRGGRGYNNMEIWDGRERAGDIIIWKYMTAERRRGR